jgi:RHS repeat-associated protein
LNAAGNVVSKFAHGSRMNVPDYMTKGGKTYQIVCDYLGSPRLVVDVADGSIVQSLGYDEFGNVLLDTNPGFQPFGFAGGLYDHQTGLTRLGARDYDGRTGRWTAKDPILFNGDGTNLYLFSMGDPINNLDASGTIPCPARSPCPEEPKPNTPTPPAEGRQSEEGEKGKPVGCKSRLEDLEQVPIPYSGIVTIGVTKVDTGKTRQFKMSEGDEPGAGSGGIASTKINGSAHLYPL